MKATIKYRFVLLFFLMAAFCLAPAAVYSAPSSDKTGTSSKSGGKKSSSKKKTSSKKTSSSKSKASSSRTTSKSSSSKKDSSNSSSSKDKQYKQMPLEQWTPPDPYQSELGLPIAEGFVQPYPYGNLMRQFNGGKNCHHRGLDIGAVGKVNGGLGTPIRAVTRSKVTLIGITGQNVGEFGRLDTRDGQAIRSGRKYDRAMYVPGYGRVFMFSKNYGRWRSGTVIVTKVLDGPLKDYTIRYMHMATVRPGLKVGDIVEAGEHIAIMGGTAILDSGPHVHIDMENPQKQRRDLAPYIGLPDTSLSCGREYADKPPVVPKKRHKDGGDEGQKTSGSREPIGKTGILQPLDDGSPILRLLQREERNPADDLL